MRIKINLLLFYSILVYACTNSSEKNQEVSNITKETITTVENSDSLDSIWLADALVTAKGIVKENLNRQLFEGVFEIMPEDCFYKIITNIRVGDLFDRDEKFAIIQRSYGGMPSDSYLYKSDLNQILKEITHKDFSYFGFIKDTIFDVNGDGLKDFVTHLYPSSGCCRRNGYYVNLQRTTGEFSEEMLFINPTFYPKEKTIRGVDYGHPGEVGLYKFKWNGYAIDTVEYIYPIALGVTEFDNEKFIKTKKHAYRPKAADGQVLLQLPKEYETVQDLNWFLSFRTEDN